MSSLATEGPYIGTIDAGTSSVRFILFDKSGQIADWHQAKLGVVAPRSGWIEQDATEIIEKIELCVAQVMRRHKKSEVVAVGLTNQRETAVMWDATTGVPLCPAIVWQDTRTDAMVERMAATLSNGKDHYRPLCGLPLATYFSALKFKWMFDNHDIVRQAAGDRNLKMGTVDSWVMYKLLGRHITDVTNASRTMLMNIETLEWEQSLCDAFQVPMHALPKIVASSMNYGGILKGPLAGLSMHGCLGDQMAATVGQLCLNVGDVKSTMGTGCFLLCNTGRDAVQSKCGLLTTVLYKTETGPTMYALEGAIAVAGQTLRWLEDGVGVVKSAQQCTELAQRKLDSLEDGCAIGEDPVFVSAFNGLYAPYWDSSARGIICGLSLKCSKEDICYAAFESVCHRTREVIAAMRSESEDMDVSVMKIDGGMSQSDCMAQMLANTTGVTVRRPKMVETTALGAAIAAGLSSRFWISMEHVRECVERKEAMAEWKAHVDADALKRRISQWDKAVKRSRGWMQETDTEETQQKKGWHSCFDAGLGFCPFTVAVQLAAGAAVAHYVYKRYVSKKE